MALFAPGARSQYWQQELQYFIDISLNEKKRTLDGYEKIVYLNNSPDTLSYIWFHLWPNAYKNDRTSFSEQMLENGKTNFYFSSREEKGYINRLDFKVDGITSRTEDHPSHLDITKLVLPKPLAPGDKITITTPFHVKLPFNFSRGGYDGRSFQVTQWYPKPAVYDRNGWHPMPYLDQGEFYSEFGKYDVKITVPEEMVVAATGKLQNKDELEWLKTKKFQPVTVLKKNVARKNSANNKKPTSTVTPSKGIKTLHYIQENVHDFAWFADPELLVYSDTCILNGGKKVDLFVFYTAGEHEEWQHAIKYSKDALRFYSDEVGQYPYDVLSVVQGPPSFGGGMEYPTITVISPGIEGQSLELIIAHEIGHNWFYGILASNEREHPWMDEGLNSFYEKKYEAKRFGPPTKEVELFFQTKAKRRTDQPIATRSEDLSPVNYGLIAYHKAGSWFQLVEKKMGEEKFRHMIQEYYQQWKFRHPQPRDLKNIIAHHTGNDSSALLSLLYTKGILPGNEPKGFKIVSPFKKNSITNYLTDPSKDILFISPAIGSNSYDRFMLGGLFTNYKLPPTSFNYLAVPMYAFGSKQVVGLGKLNYSFHSNGRIRKTDIFLNASRFSRDDFADTTGRKINMNFQKIVPGIRFTLKEKDPRSTARTYLQWKTFFIDEEFLRIRPDTIIQGTDTARILRYSTPLSSRYLNQLRFVFENRRELYPFRVQIQAEQAKDFVRPTITADYFFNYAKGGGLSLRFFAGKFLYLGGADIFKRFANERFHLNMTGPNGYEDYTYSNYFRGRSEFEGLASQQIMMRDGGFKLRTDLLSNKIGRSDNWLMALNLNTSVPESVNPLSVLPVKIPLKVFFDLGTHAGPWQKDSDEDRILYNAGFHLPLFGESLNIYIPILYNKVYGDYIKSTINEKRFLRTISFTMDFFNNRGLKKINQELEF
jgi:hypothetical protein